MNSDQQESYKKNTDNLIILIFHSDFPNVNNLSHLLNYSFLPRTIRD